MSDERASAVGATGGEHGDDATSASDAARTPRSSAPATPTYEQASARVEEIIRRLDSGAASLGETLALVQEGKALIELCANELGAVGAALEELRLDELVGRLEREAAT